MSSTPRRLEPLEHNHSGKHHPLGTPSSNKDAKLRSSLGLEFKALPDVVPGDQDYYLYPPPPESERPLRLDPLRDFVWGGQSYVEKEEDQVLALELRKTVEGVGFRVHESPDGKIRVSRVFMDHRAPFPKYAGPDDECLVIEGDIVLKIGDLIPEDAEKAKQALFDVQHGTFVRVHLLREGLMKKREDARLREEASRPKIDPKVLEAQQLDARLLKEEQAKLAKKLEMHKLAKDCVLLREFIRACDANFTVPDVEIMLKIRDSFGQRRSIEEEMEDSVYRINFGDMVNLKPIQVYIMCQVLSELREHPSLSWCKVMELNFAWRSLDRMTLSGIALLLKTVKSKQPALPEKDEKSSQASVRKIRDPVPERIEDSDEETKDSQDETGHPMNESRSKHVSLYGHLTSSVPSGGRALPSENQADKSKAASAPRVIVVSEGIDTGIDISTDRPEFYGNDFLRDVGSIFRGIERLSQISLQKSKVDDSIVDGLLGHLRTCVGLETLDLSHNSFGKKMAAGIASAMSEEEIDEIDKDQLKKVVSINLGWNELREPGGIALFSGLMTAAKPVKLVVLNVSFNGLTDAVASEIRKLLESGALPSLEELDISNNLIQHEGGLELAAAIEHPDCPLAELSCGFNKLGFDATVALLGKSRRSSKLEILRVENTCGDYSLSAWSGAFVESEAKGLECKFADDAVQYLWDLKEYANKLRIDDSVPMIDYFIEYPFKLRLLTQPLHWFHKPLNVESKNEEAENLVEEDNHLKLTHSIFNIRTKEADSRCFFDTAKVAVRALQVDWTFLKAKLLRFLHRTPDAVDDILALLNGTHYLELQAEQSAQAAMEKALSDQEAIVKSAALSVEQLQDQRQHDDLMGETNAGQYCSDEMVGSDQVNALASEAAQAAKRAILPENKAERELAAIAYGDFLVLYNAYRHCAALGNEDDCIGFNEFLEFCSRCQITDSRDCPETAAQGAFVAANVEIQAETKSEKKAMDENPDSALCLYEFIEALVRLAVKKFMPPAKMDANWKDSQTKSYAQTPAEAVKRLMLQNIQPNCVRIDANVFRRDKMYWYDVVLVLEHYKQKLDKIWRENANNTGANLLMDKSAFKALLAPMCSTLLPASPDSATGKKANIRLFPSNAPDLSFWEAKTMLSNTLVRNVRETARCPVDMLTSVEFYEALVRMADRINNSAAYEHFGLPLSSDKEHQPLISQRLVCVLELLLGSASKNCYEESKCPALRERLLNEHEPMEAPTGKMHIFEDWKNTI